MSEAEEIAFIWEGIPIKTTIERNWPIEGTANVEVRCEEPLPITKTGYRSSYPTLATIDELGGLET